jgi:NADPH:quinone reductase-like Zn-dependent oxidoreductase
MPPIFPTRVRVALAAIATVFVFGSALVQAQTTQQQYRLTRAGDSGPYQLGLTSAPVRQPGDNEVLVKVRAVSLNRRDIMIAKGFYPVGDRKALVPLSDGAGDVVAVGRNVTRFKPGARVAAIFFQDWLEGRPTPAAAKSAMGGEIDGMLAEYVTLNEQGLVAIPEHLSYEEAATLPCAGVTAWNGLVTRGNMRAGDYVLLQGTGGVSVFGLQFATAAGAKPIVTSSSDSKLARAKSLGAVATVNYRATADWEKPVLAATNGAGVQHVLEVGGEGTLQKSLAVLGLGGNISIIGGLAGFGGQVPTMGLLGRSATVSGIYVGSRADFEAMNAFITKHKLKPVIDKVFELKEAQAAYDYMDSGSHFGKIVIRM